MNSVKRSTPIRKRPAKSRPRVANARRVRKYNLNLPFSKQLVVSLRKFRTSENRRSKSKRQLIVPISILRIREVGFELNNLKSKKRTRKFILVPLARAPMRTALACSLIIAGIISGFMFGTHLQKPVDFTIRPAHPKVMADSITAKRVMPRSIPIRLQIPKISVDTALSQVGLQANGQMEMPWDIETAAWYQYSPTPGELGPSVIVGHVDGANYANMAGVFYHLNELSPGDQIIITRADGTIATFKVLYLKQVPQNNFPTQEIYGNINYAGIRLITCGGTFDSTTGHYNNNTVVFGALQ